MFIIYSNLDISNSIALQLLLLFLVFIQLLGTKTRQYDFLRFDEIINHQFPDTFLVKTYDSFGIVLS